MKNKVVLVSLAAVSMMILSGTSGCTIPAATSASPAFTRTASSPVNPQPAPGAAVNPAAGVAGGGPSSVYGIGRSPSAQQIAAWDIDISPDGSGLPGGSGTPVQGAPVFAARCAACHGDKGQGGTSQTSEVLVGTQSWFQLGNPNSVGRPTIGNYWPYATTVFDYVRRAMPFDEPQSLTNDEVYQVVAWLLNQNGIIGDKDVMDARTLPDVKMPNRDGFLPDPRPWPEVQ